MLMAAKNSAHRNGIQTVTDIDISSVKFNVIKGMPSEQEITDERDDLLEAKLMKQGSSATMHSANEVFLFRKQNELK